MKRNVIIYSFFTLAIVLIANLANAQKGWTLQACIDQAVNHNLQAKDRSLTMLSLEEEKRQSVRAMLPTVQAFSSYSISYGRSIDPNTNAVVRDDFFFNNYGLDADIDIFQGFQKQHQRQASKFLYEASLKENEQEKYLLAFRVMSAFYDVIFFEGALENAQNQIQISETNKSFVEKQIKVGLAPGSEIHMANSTLIADEFQVLSAQNKLQAAKLRLIQEMNLTATNITLEWEENFTPSPTKQTLDALYTRALSQLPIVQSQALKVQSAESNLKQSRSMLTPSLSAFAGYGTGFFETNVNSEQALIPFNTQLKTNASQYVGLSLRVPILDAWTRRSRVSQRKIDLLREVNNLEIQKQEVQKTIQEAHAAQRAAYSEYEKSSEGTAALAVAFEIANKKFEKGLISALELYRAKNLLAQSQNEKLQLKMKSAVLNQTLDFYAGISVFNLQKSNQ